MCFEQDADWTASVCEETEQPAETEFRCDECGQRFPAGTWQRYVFLQEYEECQRCEWEELAPEDEPCETHEYGEVAHYRCCRACDLILQAVAAVETAEGCPPHSRRPLLGELAEALQYDEERRYLTRALAMFPEVKDSYWVRLQQEREEEHGTE